MPRDLCVIYMPLSITSVLAPAVFWSGACSVGFLGLHMALRKVKPSASKLTSVYALSLTFLTVVFWTDRRLHERRKHAIRTIFGKLDLSQFTPGVPHIESSELDSATGSQPRKDDKRLMIIAQNQIESDDGKCNRWNWLKIQAFSF